MKKDLILKDFLENECSETFYKAIANAKSNNHYSDTVIGSLVSGLNWMDVIALERNLHSVLQISEQIYNKLYDDASTVLSMNKIDTIRKNLKLEANIVKDVKSKKILLKVSNEIQFNQNKELLDIRKFLEGTFISIPEWREMIAQLDVLSKIDEKNREIVINNVLNSLLEIHLAKCVYNADVNCNESIDEKEIKSNKRTKVFSFIVVLILLCIHYQITLMFLGVMYIFDNISHQRTVIKNKEKMFIVQQQLYNVLNTLPNITSEQLLSMLACGKTFS